MFVICGRIWTKTNKQTAIWFYRKIKELDKEGEGKENEGCYKSIPIRIAIISSSSSLYWTISEHIPITITITIMIFVMIIASVRRAGRKMEAGASYKVITTLRPLLLQTL